MSNYKVYIRILLIGLVLCTICCTESCSSRRALLVLDDVESYIQERPDSAFKVLNGLDRTLLTTDKLRAKFSLLYSAVLNKNHIDTSDLSIIQPAVDFYSKNGPPVEKMKAYYYCGCIHVNRGEDDLAMHDYQLALEDSSIISENFFKERKINRLRLATILLSSLFFIGVIVVLYFRKKRELDNRIEELSDLHFESQQMLNLQNVQTAAICEQLAQKDAALLQLRKQFASLYKAQFRTLNDLCSAYLSPVKKDRKDVLYAEAMRQLDVIVNDSEAQNKFMSMVNGSLDSIIDKFRRDMPGRKELDYRFFMYVIVGFDATTISNLTGYSVGTVYTKKNRLKGELSNLSSEFRDFYLEFID